EVAVILHREVAATAGAGASPSGLACCVVDDEIAVPLHRDGGTRRPGLCRPERVTIPVNNEVPIALHNRDVLPTRRAQVLPGGKGSGRRIGRESQREASGFSAQNRTSVIDELVSLHGQEQALERRGLRL